MNGRYYVHERAVAYNVLFVSFRQNHISWLTKHASKETGNKGGTDTHQQLDSVTFSHVGEKCVKDSSKNIKGNFLFSKGVRNLNT
jgi:hypothetical protein